MDGAEGALVAAALADLEPGVGRSGGEQAAAVTRDLFRRIGQTQGVGQQSGPVRQIPRGQPEVHLGQFPGQFLRAVAAHHATGHGQQRFVLAAGQPVYGVQHGFAHGRGDKAAGIDENQTRPAHLGHAFDGHAQRTEQTFAVHPVFGAPQTQGPDRQGFCCNARVHRRILQRARQLVTRPAPERIRRASCKNDRQHAIFFSVANCVPYSGLCPDSAAASKHALKDGL